MLIDRGVLSAAEVAAATGWELKPEGACRGHECVPLPDLDVGAPIALEAFADAMGMGVAHDADHGLWGAGRPSVDVGPGQCRLPTGGPRRFRW